MPYSLQLFRSRIEAFEENLGRLDFIRLSMDFVLRKARTKNVFISILRKSIKSKFRDMQIAKPKTKKICGPFKIENPKSGFSEPTVNVAKA